MHATADSYEQGLRLSACGRHIEAIEQYERALATRPDDARVLFALGNTARGLGMAGPAEEFFRRVLSQEPGRLEALVSLANLLRAQGQLPAAQALLAPALARDPDSPELWLTLGSTYREMGDYGPRRGTLSRGAGVEARLCRSAGQPGGPADGSRRDGRGAGAVLRAVKSANRTMRRRG